jgi:hypothetical protein
MNDGISLEGQAKQGRRLERIGRIAEGGLVERVARAGGELQGLSVKYKDYECLVTLRATMPAGPMVAFIGAETLGGCLLKAYSHAGSDELRWRVDQYAKG